MDVGTVLEANVSYGRLSRLWSLFGCPTCRGLRKNSPKNHQSAIGIHSATPSSMLSGGLESEFPGRF